MVTITCDRCDRKLQVPDDKRGTKIECPHCGDTNVVPAEAVVLAAVADGAAGGRAAGKKDRPAELGLPPDRGPERQVLKVRPAMLRARPILFLVLAAAAGGGAVGAAVFAARGPVTYAYIATAVGVAGIIALLIWKFKTMFVSLEITNKRTVETRGLFSRATSEVLHDDIKNLQITQSFWQRIWGVGTIGISSAGQDGIEIQAQDMPRPMEIRRVIDAYRDTLG
jgi:hypothetical protein